MNEYFAMGGYAFYVWGSVGITAVVLIWNLISPKLKRKTLLREVSAQIARKQRTDETQT